METRWILLTMGVALVPLGIGFAAEEESGNDERDQRIEALTERVDRLEAAVGQDSRPVLTQPSMGRRLDLLEREIRGNSAPALSPPRSVRESIRQLNRSLLITNRNVEDLAKRLERADGETYVNPGADDLSSLRRDLDTLQRRDLRNLRQDIGNLQRELDNLERKVDRLISGR